MLSFLYVLKILTSLLSSNFELDASESSWEILRWLSLLKRKPSRPGVVGSMLLWFRRRKLLINPFFLEILIEVIASLNLFFSFDWIAIPSKELLESFYIYNNESFNVFSLIAFITWTQLTLLIDCICSIFSDDYLREPFII